MRLSLYTTLAVLACSVSAIQLSSDIDLGIEADHLPLDSDTLLGVPITSAAQTEAEKVPPKEQVKKAKKITTAAGPKVAVPGHNHRHRVGSAAMAGAVVPGADAAAVAGKVNVAVKTPEAAKNEASAVKAKAESAAKTEALAKQKIQEAEKAKAHAIQKQNHNRHEHQKNQEIKKKAAQKIEREKVRAKQVKDHGKKEARIQKKVSEEMDKKNRELELVNEKTARQVEEIMIRMNKTIERKHEEEERKIEDARRRKAMECHMVQMGGHAGGCGPSIQGGLPAGAGGFMHSAETAGGIMQGAAAQAVGMMGAGMGMGM